MTVTPNCETGVLLRSMRQYIWNISPYVSIVISKHLIASFSALGYDFQIEFASVFVAAESRNILREHDFVQLYSAANPRPDALSLTSISPEYP